MSSVLLTLMRCILLHSISCICVGLTHTFYSTCLGNIELRVHFTEFCVGPGLIR
jgi:hypothetical protein